ncbi:MAG: xanthine dehydrogenase family protein subunit M [Bryobacteraceae bacterium]
MRPFTYSRPDTVDSAVRAYAEKGPEVRYIGGGTNLIDLMKMGVERPAHLIDINRLPLTTIEEHEGGLRIGALVRNTDCASHEQVRQRYPILSQAILAGASGQLRNMATMGGNLLQSTRCYYFYDPAYHECNMRVPGSGCAATLGVNRIHAILGASEACIATNPSDMSVGLAVLDAKVNVHGPKGDRVIPLAEFHRLPGTTPHITTNLHPGELITSIDLPSMDFGTRFHYVKVRDRRSYAFALVSVAAVMNLDTNGSIREARFALGGVARKPWRSQRSEQLLVGKSPSPEVFRQAAELAVKGATPLRDNAFKVELARRAIVRALTTVSQG